MNRKIILVCISLAIICMALYFVFIPHEANTSYFSNNVMEKTVTVEPLTMSEILINEIRIFIFINIPTIVILLKYGVKKMLGINIK